MSRMARNSLVALMVGILVASLSITAVAAEEGGGGDGGAGDATTTTVETGLSPAVPINTEVPAESQADWTYRYIVPTGLALAAIIILFTAIKYFTDVVRKRYRIVE